MAMFGYSRSAAPAPAPADRSQLSRRDRLALFGATLRDVGAGLGGGQGDAINQQQSMFGARQQMAQRQAAEDEFARAMQPGAPMQPQGPISTPPLLSAGGVQPQGQGQTQERAAALLKLARLGLDIEPYIKALKFGQEADQPFVVNPNQVAYRNAGDFQNGGKPLISNRDEGYTLAPGAQRYENGRMVASAPFPEQIVTASPGSTVLAVDRNGGGSPPLLSGRAGRNNNPGNLRDSGDQWQGMTGVDDGGFVQFDTPQSGERAAGINLANQTKVHGIRTLAGLVQKYAPASDNNDVGGYISAVSRATGLDPNQEVDFSDPAIQAKVLPAMYAVESGGSPSSAAPGVRTLQQGRPATTYRPATAQEKANYGIAADVPAQMGPDGRIDVVNGTGANLKPVPAPIQQGYLENRNASAEIDKAIKSIRENPGALGLRNALGDTFNQRFNPKGVTTRALVAKVGAMKRHEVSGAAVTLSEQPNLLPFIPGVTDKDEAAIEKLLVIKNWLDSGNTEIETAYGEGSGFRPMGGQAKAQSAPAGASARAAAPPKMSDRAPVPGAQKGNNGQWHIEDPNKKGSFPQVQKGPNGKWRIKSANGQMLEWE